MDIPRRQILKGGRLPGPEARVYQPILPQGGRFASVVLDLDLMVREGTVRFFAGNAELLGGKRLVLELERMLDEAHGRSEQAQEAAAEACAALAGMVLGVLQLRGLPVNDEQRARLQGCRDLDQLKRWAAKATTVSTVEDLLLEQ